MNPTFPGIVSPIISPQTFLGKEESDDTIDLKEECIICHDEFNLPVTLDCNHKYCFLCIKSWKEQNDSCPMCRKEIMNLENIEIGVKKEENKFQWLYSGRSGKWWEYDPVNNQIIEENHQKGKDECEILTGRFEYKIDFTNMTQERNGRVRNIKRIISEQEDVKGVAGIVYKKIGN